MKNNTKNNNEVKKNNINWKRVFEKAKSILLSIFYNKLVY